MISTKNLKPVTITNQKQLTHGVYVLSFKKEFDFVPGQIIGLTNNLDLAPRLYSICSANSSEFVDILYQVKNDGQLTPSLEHNKPGDTVWITNVQGKFTFNNEPAWWIATGTGIAPFYSMFKSGQRPKKLIQGGRYISNIYFQDDLNKLNDYIVCCSADKGKTIYEGRLSKYLKEYDNLPTNINYYLCGSAEMVVDIRNLLLEKKVPFNQIITEIYF